jgi:transcriptional regulator with XRE-family HTH domain
MANRLKMAEQQAIIALAQRGWSFRRIARELGVHRETVSQYARRGAEATGPDPPEPAISIGGSEGVDPAISITGSAARWFGCGGSWSQLVKAAVAHRVPTR